MKQSTKNPASNRRPIAAALASAEPSALEPIRPAKLEKIAAAASRMAVSIAQVYREVKAGRLTIIKLGPRASALDSFQVDTWISTRIKEAQQGGANRKDGAQ